MGNLGTMLVLYTVFAVVIQTASLAFVWFDTLSRRRSPERWFLLVLFTGPFGLIFYLAWNISVDRASQQEETKISKPQVRPPVNRYRPVPPVLRPRLQNL